MNYNEEILNNLIVYESINPKIRLGNKKDGGYVIVDNLTYDSYASFGMGDNVTFDEDFVKYRPNIPAFAFDGTVNRPANLPAEITFFKENINYNNTAKEYLEKYNDIFVKMDIEGDEWNWIRGFEKYLPKIKQLVFEGHEILEQNPRFYVYVQPMSWKNVLTCLQILNKTHYLVHIHQNNNNNNRGEYTITYNDNIYSTYSELTFIRKDCEIKGLNTQKLPIENLDFKTSFSHREHNMNIWPFVHDSH